MMHNFLEILKAHELLWTVIVSGNFSLAEKSDLEIVFGNPTLFRIEKFYLNDELCFDELKVEKKVEYDHLPPEEENEYYKWSEEKDRWLNNLKKDHQDYESIKLSFYTQNSNLFLYPEKFFDKDKIMTFYHFDPEKKAWSKSVKKHVIEYSNEKFPISIRVRQYAYGYAVYVEIIKSGKFKSVREFYEAIGKMDPSEIKVTRHDP